MRHFICSLTIEVRMAILYFILDALNNAEKTKGMGYVNKIANYLRLSDSIDDVRQMNIKDACKAFDKEKEDSDIKVFFRAVLEYFLTVDGIFYGYNYYSKRRLELNGIWSGFHCSFGKESSDPLENEGAWKFKIYFVPLAEKNESKMNSFKLFFKNL